MSCYESIIGHTRQIAQLEKARQQERVAHAYLFCGPDGVGKEKVALTFAMALNCEANEGAPCGQCENCLKALKGTHPDVRLLASEEELVLRGLFEPAKGHALSEQIKNAQLDELSQLFRHRPYLGRFKVVLVVEAERMNVHCQNRFLKTLEEPSRDTVILLITAHPESLLPTVRSRCQVMTFGPVPREQVAGFLREEHGLDEEPALVLASMSQGSLKRAQELSDGAQLSARDEWIEAHAKIRHGDLEDMLSFSGSIGEGQEGREHLRNILDCWELWFRDMLFLQLGAPRILFYNQDQKDALERQSRETSPWALLRWMEGVRRTRDVLSANANPRLALEAYLLSARAS